MITKKQFLRGAILQTIFTGLLYLSMPPLAQIYYEYFGDKYIGYTIAGGTVLGIGSFILLLRAWYLAFDKGARKNYNSED